MGRVGINPLVLVLALGSLGSTDSSASVLSSVASVPADCTAALFDYGTGWNGGGMAFHPVQVKQFRDLKALLLRRRSSAMGKQKIAPPSSANEKKLVRMGCSKFACVERSRSLDSLLEPSRRQTPQLRKSRLQPLSMSVPGSESAAFPFSSKNALEATFGQAQEIGEALGASLLQCATQGVELSGVEKDVLHNLLSHSDGARGFYVTTLTIAELDGVFQADRIDPELVKAIASSPKPNVRLLVMNLAMSTATELAHLANGNSEYAAGSRLTRDRTRILINAMLAKLPQLGEELKVLKAIVDGETVQDEDIWQELSAFLNRWGYDDKQRAAISDQIRLVGLPE